MSAFTVPKPEPEANGAPFEFKFPGTSTTFTMPNAGTVIDVDKTIELALMPNGQATAVQLQLFVQAMPEEARKLFKSKKQIGALFNAWQQHGNGVSAGEA